MGCKKSAQRVIFFKDGVKWIYADAEADTIEIISRMTFHKRPRS